MKKAKQKTKTKQLNTLRKKKGESDQLNCSY